MAQSPVAQSPVAQPARQQPASLRLRARTGAQPAAPQPAGARLPAARRPAPWPASAAGNLAAAGEQLARLPVSVAPAQSGPAPACLFRSRPVGPFRSGRPGAVRSRPADSGSASASCVARDPDDRRRRSGRPAARGRARAAHSPAGRRGPHEPVVVVPGGHRPGKPDQVQRDQARARLALTGPARIVVLGCTAGAGQTMTTLITGQLLAQPAQRGGRRARPQPRPGSLTEQASG